jgi:hypothetical protein
MVESILMKQVCLVDEKDGAHALLGEVLDARAYGQEQIASRVGLSLCNASAGRVGRLLYDDTGAVVLEPDAQVRETIAHVLETLSAYSGSVRTP